jgi:hypothetical protein
MTVPQARFISYTLFVLVDLVVLNVFDEYWDLVSIESFTISFAAAVLLQVLLKLTIALEHKVAAYFKAKPGTGPKIARGVISYLIVVLSKFVMLEAVSMAFGERVHFGGKWHGLIPFVAVILSIIIAEAVMTRVYRRLGGRVEG